MRGALAPVPPQPPMKTYATRILDELGVPYTLREFLTP